LKKRCSELLEASVIMRVAIATIRLMSPAEGGKRLAIRGDYRCPVFFRNVPELSLHGYECRLLLGEISIVPGETARDVPIAFLSPNDVFPHLNIGVRFRLWEGRDIGDGEITRMPD